MVAVTLALSGAGHAIVRTADAPVMQTTLCTGTDTSVIYLGADGAPTEAPHVCPDCLAADAFATPSQPSAAPAPFDFDPACLGMAPLALADSTEPQSTPARAPPL